MSKQNQNCLNISTAKPRQGIVNCIFVEHEYKMDFECRTLILSRSVSLECGVRLANSGKLSFRDLIVKRGYSEKAAEELWKWYDFSDKKGVASF